MEEKGTIHIHLLTELTGNLYSEESEWEEDWSESDAVRWNRTCRL